MFTVLYLRQQALTIRAVKDFADYAILVLVFDFLVRISRFGSTVGSVYIHVYM